jgi:hypothetical protein
MCGLQARSPEVVLVPLFLVLYQKYLLSKQAEDFLNWASEQGKMSTVTEDNETRPNFMSEQKTKPSVHNVTEVNKTVRIT